MLRIPEHSDKTELPHGTRRSAAPEGVASELNEVREVRKEFLHLRFDDSVLLTGWQRLDDMEFTISARWPGFVRAATGDGVRHDPQVVARTIRQSGLLLAHGEFGAPLDHAVLLRAFDFTVEADYQPPQDEPIDLVLRVSCAEMGRRGKRLTGLRLHMDIHSLDGVRIGTGTTDFEWIAPRVYRRLRDTHAAAVSEQPPLPEPVPPVRVGRTREDEVAIAPTADPRRWQLRCDFSNTILYDHPVDHVPGLVMIEAAHQAAQLIEAGGAPGTFRPTSATTSFGHYVEFDAPCWIEATVDGGPAGTDGSEGGVRVSVTGYQGDNLVFTTELTGAGSR
ncbi:ScbA/BarX family gamma-butyrolactone biosynthesis protein [Streptomyces pinistramenti]|uniref:ScbA/BarX family gamma-butyrolactone biosynthesis protein n=1 Tax=Streptomyces pinistramenti TaxID=2884812 RepID=UPI001D097DF6|nr:ScbA/BarX family gamma-butyrolactone biosynthesis protein [Streptomyces pinistramenti]MCB5908963.1 A-factor biosynthesis protein [Streptomyces pinistramenti]